MTGMARAKPTMKPIRSPRLPDGIIATGDPSEPIFLLRNYWGTIDSLAIEAMILDGRDEPDRPELEYLPILIGPTSTAATPTSATFKSTGQPLTLTATVTASRYASNAPAPSALLSRTRPMSTSTVARAEGVTCLASSV